MHIKKIWIPLILIISAIVILPFCGASAGGKCPGGGKHDFTLILYGMDGSILNPVYEEATCQHGTLYFYACSKCKCIAQNEKFTFDNGDILPHDFSSHSHKKQYLAFEATCEHPAEYYLSCQWCGEAGNETFTYGEALDHDFSAERAKDRYCFREASCTQRAKYYRSCVYCGLSCEDKSNSFLAGDYLPHNFTREYVSSEYKADRATCQRPPLYYLSCTECGASSEDLDLTFTHGKTADHCYSSEIAEKRYLYEKATCVSAAKYYRSCKWCGKSCKDPDNLFTYGTALGHDFSRMSINSRYLAVFANCQHPDRYFYSCTRCGEAGSKTFDYGCRTDHDYSCYNPEDEYLACDATCIHGKQYYVSCCYCGAASNKTFYCGSPLGHEWSEYIGQGNGIHMRTCSRCGLTSSLSCSFSSCLINGILVKYCPVCGDCPDGLPLSEADAYCTTLSKLSEETRIIVRGGSAPEAKDALLQDTYKPLYVITVACVRDGSIVKLSNPMTVTAKFPTAEAFTLNYENAGEEETIDYQVDENGYITFNAPAAGIYVLRSTSITEAVPFADTAAEPSDNTVGAEEQSPIITEEAEPANG